MKILVRKITSFILILAMMVTLCPQMQLIDVSAESEEMPYCISVGRPVYASSQNDGLAPEYAVDGDDTTRWQAANDDEEEWFYVDLGAKADIDHVYINWEAAYAKSYQIQFSDDEENWRTVYTKGKGASTGGNGETSVQSMTVSRNSISKKGEKNVTTLSWTALDGVSYYYIYLDDIADKTPATAADGYPFNGTWGTRTTSEVWVRDGKHTYTVVAYDANEEEIARASIEIDSEEIEEDTTASSGGTTQDVTKQTITFDGLSQSEKQARYVRILMTERQMQAYGCSFFEFQVYGSNGGGKKTG